MGRKRADLPRGLLGGNMEELIVIKQLPIIEERLQTLKDRWEQRAADAEAMVCTEETIQAVKAFRAEMRKEFESAEALRKEIEAQIMFPVYAFRKTYKDCITASFDKADGCCKDKIYEVENEQKRRCEEGLRDYFAELCAVHHLDWLEYERAGIKVDMASAKAKTPKRLREQLVTFVVGVSESVERISALENADEIMVEYSRTLDATGAICTVQDRHRRIEQERAAQEARKAVLEQEAEAVRRVESLAPPVQVDPPKIVKCTFTVRTTMDKLKKLKQFLEVEGIQYE